MKSLFSVFLFFFLFSSTSIYAQSDSSVTKEKFPRRITTDVVYAMKSTLHVYKRPFSWKKKEWIKFGAVMGTVALASFLDEPIDNFFRRNHSKY